MRGAAERVLTRGSEQKFRIALCIPMGGSDGIWGPSCLASARLAEAELNRFDGIAGRACELVPWTRRIRRGIEHRLSDLVDEGEVDALVGMHISSVRQRIAGAVGGAFPTSTPASTKAANPRRACTRSAKPRRSSCARRSPG